MTGMARRARGARGHLSRLAVVLAVLAGLALVLGVQCTDGMSMAHGPDTVMVDSGDAVPVDHHDGRPAAPELGTSSSSGTGEALAACLMLVVAVIALTSGLTPPGPRTSTAAPRPATGALTAPVLPSPPSLAKLCLLRM
jgi:hypothetical protein